MSDLNKWLTTNIEDIPEADVSEFEKKQLKKRILGQRRKSPWLKNVALAAGIAVAVSTTAFAAFPSLASQIPILQDIVSYFDGDELIFNHFSEVAQPIGLEETSNGATITIEEAVYDGTSVTVAFALQTTTDLGEFPNADGLLEAPWTRGSGSVTSMNKVNDTTYAGMLTMAPNFLWKAPQTIKLKWAPESFTDMETGAKVEGDWEFTFNLNALNSVKVPVNQTVDFEGGSYKLDELRLTKLSTVLAMHKKDIDEDRYITDWQLVDDLGNIYPMHFGTGNESQLQFTFETLDPQASSIRIEPLIKRIEHAEDDGVPIEATIIHVDLR
ncbi:hypothetical protein HNQ44_001281 [Planomicrobium koreense]|uniref:DUF4179 domain-containing protein n=1 Tax=Planococcus koreensis TaxID=112331 RepID=A0A7W8FUJ3_9BACL|nr:MULTISPECIES: DUF4179 domain-containing protein [Planococcus]MBB5179857.1 hypothetical protein [Planococcus koreensis]MDN3451770.1 DUF4179 domain-containing protein [Planococcus sp. APC 3906]